MKSLFSNKVRMNTRNEYKIANIFNTFFIEIVPDLGTKVHERYADIISDPIEKVIRKQ